MNILANLTPAEYRDVRKLTIDCILATDMACHFEVVSKFDSKVKTTFSFDASDDRELLLRVYIKCADISNVCKPFDLAFRWSNLLMREFVNQVRPWDLLLRSAVLTRAHRLSWPGR